MPAREKAPFSISGPQIAGRIFLLTRATNYFERPLSTRGAGKKGEL